MSERDYQKDLEVCEKATPEPWYDEDGEGHIISDNLDIADVWNSADKEFIITARELLPYYINETFKERTARERMEGNAALRIEGLEVERDDVKAEAAVMRGFILSYRKEITPGIYPPLDILFEQALSSTAGQDLLDRLEKAEMDLEDYSARTKEKIAAQDERIKALEASLQGILRLIDNGINCTEIISGVEMGAYIGNAVDPECEEVVEAVALLGGEVNE